MNAHHNHWDTSAIRDKTSRNISSTSTTESPEVVRQLEMMNKNFLEMMGQFQMVKTVDTKCKIYGGPHSFTECPAIDGYTHETAYAAIEITTRSGVSYDGPPIPPPTSSLPKVVERVPEVTEDMVQPSTENFQPPVAQTQVLIDEPVVAPKPKPTIPYPLRVTKQKLPDHLSRLENLYQDELEKREITETFPLETLGMIAFRGDSSTPWFADIANYHAKNFIVKGMSSQQKKKFFKTLSLD
nr:reverse transcriptase domain-containing protein [Tanacetum cinerariifolium]